MSTLFGSKNFAINKDARLEVLDLRRKEKNKN